MPTYNYNCPDCDNEFSLRRSSEERDNEVECPSCGSMKPSRTMSSFAVGSTGTDSGGAPCADGTCPLS